MPGLDRDLAAPPEHDRRGLTLLLVLVPVLLLVQTVGLGPVAALPTTDAAEAQFLTLLDQERAASGLAPMHRDGGLDAMAREWSGTMAAANTLRHRPDLASQFVHRFTTPWKRGGENVGRGPTVEWLHQAFMASPEHRDNVLGSYDRVGIGVVLDGGGMWVTINFLQGTEIAGPTGSEAVPAARIDAVVALSRGAFPNGAPAAIIANDQHFADLVAAAPLAAAVHGPVLLNPAGGLHPSVEAELRRLGAATVFVMGGIDAQSDAVSATVASLGPQVERIAGTDRFETAAAAARTAAAWPSPR